MHQFPLTFAHFIGTAENHSALIAVRELADHLSAGRPLTGNPLLLHGPTGTGKTHLVSALVEQVTRARPELVLAHLSAGDFTQASFAEEPAEDSAQSTPAATPPFPPLPRGGRGGLRPAEGEEVLDSL